MKIVERLDRAICNSPSFGYRSFTESVEDASNFDARRSSNPSCLQIGPRVGASDNEEFLCSLCACGGTDYYVRFCGCFLVPMRFVTRFARIILGVQAMPTRIEKWLAFRMKNKTFRSSRRSRERQHEKSRKTRSRNEQRLISGGGGT